MAGMAITSGNCIRILTSLEDGDGLLKRGLHLAKPPFEAQHLQTNESDGEGKCRRGQPLIPGVWYTVWQAAAEKPLREANDS